MDPKFGSMSPEDLLTKYVIGCMIRSDSVLRLSWSLVGAETRWTDGPNIFYVLPMTLGYR